MPHTLYWQAARDKVFLLLLDRQSRSVDRAVRDGLADVRERAQEREAQRLCRPRPAPIDVEPREAGVDLCIDCGMEHQPPIGARCARRLAA